MPPPRMAMQAPGCLLLRIVESRLSTDGYSNAGEMALMLRQNQPADYVKWLANNVRQRHDPLPQPIFRLVDAMCCCLHVAFEHVVTIRGGKKGAGGGNGKKSSGG